MRRVVAVRFSEAGQGFVVNFGISYRTTTQSSMIS
ncbi:hypothetical protein PS710_01780 [Pseudomonas fluorescens]|uniref:Uncharacterized protein n=1 Tax=Pseudomonas fluorescens TaxID=294 RepID=A0A5E7BBY5_PSEFL|nr:hypothetical protein PS710_01780 [Pseudomonas fluorescens]